MWLRHFIEHLMCIGGELEHHKALPSPARKNRALWSALLRRWGIYRQLICPGSWQEPELNPPFCTGSRHEPVPMAMGRAPGPLVTGTNGSRRTGTNAHEAPAGPWAHEPGLMPPMGPGS